MTTAWEQFQQLVKAEMLKVYSEKVVKYALDPINVGRMEKPSGFARVEGNCGDTMSVWIRVEDDVVREATFTTNGCSATLASGSMVTEMARSKNVYQAVEISPEEILDSLGGLPEDHKHCANLAARTMEAAILDYLSRVNKTGKQNILPVNMVSGDENSIGT
jgi:nitrogen fixation protein NifU and related proteins